MKDDSIGLYVPAKQTCYFIKETKWTNHQMVIDRIRKTLLARGILDFRVSLLEGNKKETQSKVPIIISFKEAKNKGYNIETLFGTESEQERVQNEKDEQKPSSGVGRFGKKK